ncbi:MAG: phosphoribosyltransferase [Patescibacteria group bacterium]|mgnify:FL=1
MSDYATATTIPSYIAMLLDILWEIGAVKINVEEGYRTDFHERYPDAPRSPLYVNLHTKQNPKTGPLTTDEVGRIALAFHHLRQDMKVSPDWICGIPSAGTPFGKALSRMTDVRYLEIEEINFVGQRQMYFSGQTRPQNGDTVLIVDDILSDATMKELVFGLIKQTGATPVLFVFLDRGQGGRLQLMQEGYAVHSVLTIEMFLGYYLRSGRLSVVAREACLAYDEKLTAFKVSHEAV